MPSITRDSVRHHPSWYQIQDRVAAARTVVELCAPGLDPAVTLDDGELHVDGLRIVRQTLAPQLPFGDREFDFAVCHHAFQHVDDPVAACREMSRIARAGVVIAPAILAELFETDALPRWHVIDAGDELLFVDRATLDGSPETGDARGAEPAFGAPPPQSPPPLASPAFDVVFPWTAELRCRVVRDFP